MIDSNSKWYVLYTASGKEKELKSSIENEMKHNEKLKSYITQILVPTQKTVSSRGGKKIYTERALISGYVMIEASLKAGGFEAIKNIPGVRFLSEGRRSTSSLVPTPLQEKEVNKMLGRFSELSDESQEYVDNSFAINERVKVIDGPFSGFEGVVASISEDKRKLTINIPVFGRSTPLDLEFTQINKIV